MKKRIDSIDERVGLCNFSILGRGTESSKENKEQYNNDRKEYLNYDNKTKEREYINMFNRQFLETGVSAPDNWCRIMHRHNASWSR